MNPLTKKMLVHVTRAMFRHLYNGKYQEFNQCLRWAGLTRYVYGVMQVQGFIPKTHTPLIQAGTAQWKYKDGDIEDDCYFGYTFNEKDLLRHIEQETGENIEWHVWVGIPQTNEVIDLTTCHQFIQLRDTAINLPRNTAWEEKHALPEYIWMDSQKAFEEMRWQYLPHPLACAVATNTWGNVTRVHDLLNKSDLARLFAYCLATFKL